MEGWFERQNARAAALEPRPAPLHHLVRQPRADRGLADRAATSSGSTPRPSCSTTAGDAIGPALAVNYTSKTQYLFRINKWTLEEWDEVAINKVLAKDDRPVPFDRIAFFGDGLTDIPTMRLVTDQGGSAVAVYNPESPKSMAAARELREDGRAHMAGPADYTENSPLDRLAQALLAEMAARAHARNLVAMARRPA